MDDVMAHPFKDSFAWLQKRVNDLARCNGFWDGTPSDGEKIALMHTELSEAFEHIRKETDKDDDPKVPGHSNLSVELADVVIRVMDFAEQYGLDLAGAILAKHDFNCTRPYKHGKKF